MLSGAKVVLLARVFKLGQLLKPTAHARIQDLSARSHLWRLPRVFVPFAGSQHHEAPVRAHAVHALLPRRGVNGLQGFKLQSGRLRSLSRDSLLEDAPRIDSHHLVHFFEATHGGTGTGDVAEGERQGLFKASLSRT